MLTKELVNLMEGDRCTDVLKDALAVPMISGWMFNEG